MSGRYAMALVFMLQVTGAAAQTPGATFLEQWDADGDGRVTLEEAQSRRADLFDAFDSDGDGALEPQELADMGAMRAAMQEANRAATGRPFRADASGAAGTGGPVRLDRDGDGRVSRDEFVGSTGSWFAWRDRDGDGALTPADFGRRRR
ncbi:EF-hand domain-containing protein [Cereibacter johrii]|uniref:EF-hand domain-containing protein n=1 Tax=Cereibacter johrii TaxID=445629 RepID=UPI002B2613F8|nr:EF-hand domain-containing protein [Cereibacter johrii]MEA5161009.1 EF-hand domain-containing protein [Cereibacter johrii]